MHHRERDQLIKEHQYHMQVMGDCFQKEMDLMDIVKRDPNVSACAYNGDSARYAQARSVELMLITYVRVRRMLPISAP